MARWIRALVGAWRSQPVSWESPLSVEMAAAALKERGRRWGADVGYGGTYVRTRVRGSPVTVWLQPRGRRGGVRAISGQLVPAHSGCILVGSFGVHPFVKAFLALWLLQGGWALPSLLLVGTTNAPLAKLPLWAAITVMVVVFAAVAAAVSACLLMTKRRTALRLAVWLRSTLADPLAIGSQAH